jgi:hypothetical protein
MVVVDGMMSMIAMMIAHDDYGTGDRLVDTKIIAFDDDCNDDACA